MKSLQDESGGDQRVLDFESISAAYFMIREGIHYTPCDPATKFNYTGVDLYFKKEYMQESGSFKERGVRRALLRLSPEERENGVVAASGGDFSLGLAYQGSLLGIQVNIFMPKYSSIMNIETCRNFGARVFVTGKSLDEALTEAASMAERNKLLFMNEFDDLDVLAGDGTVGLEILEQVPTLEAVIVPVGRGSLIAGIARALKTLKPGIQIIGVEPERCSGFSEALRTGELRDSRPVRPSIAEGLSVSRPGRLAFNTAAPLIDKMVQVNEDSIALAMLRLVELEKAVVNGAGVVGLAAIISGLLPELKGKRVVIPLCGGNVDTTQFERCLERGMAADGRLAKFAVLVRDNPGGIAELVGLLQKSGASIKDIQHDRVWVRNDVFSVEIKIAIETRSGNHTKDVFDDLKSHYEVVNNISYKVFDASRSHGGINLSFPGLENTSQSHETSNLAEISPGLIERRNNEDNGYNINDSFSETTESEASAELLSIPHLNYAAKPLKYAVETEVQVSTQSSDNVISKTEDTTEGPSTSISCVKQERKTSTAKGLYSEKSKSSSRSLHSFSKYQKPSILKDPHDECTKLVQRSSAESCASSSSNAEKGEQNRGTEFASLQNKLFSTKKPEEEEEQWTSLTPLRANVDNDKNKDEQFIYNKQLFGRPTESNEEQHKSDCYAIPLDSKVTSSGTRLTHNSSDAMKKVILGLETECPSDTTDEIDHRLNILNADNIQALVTESFSSFMNSSSEDIRSLHESPKAEDCASPFQLLTPNKAQESSSTPDIQKGSSTDESTCSGKD